jgi:hypothetical protein
VLGTGSTFVGTLMAGTSISAQTSAVITGRLLANTGQVSLDSNVITRPSGCANAGNTGGTGGTTAPGGTGGTGGTGRPGGTVAGTGSGVSAVNAELAATGTESATPAIVAALLVGAGTVALVASIGSSRARARRR